MGNKTNKTTSSTIVEKKTHIHELNNIDKIFSDFWDSRPIRTKSIEEFVDIIIQKKYLFQKKGPEDKEMEKGRSELISSFMNFKDPNFPELETKFNLFLKNHDSYYVLNFIFLTNYNRGTKLFDFIEFIYYEFKDIGFQEFEFNAIPDFESFVKRLVEEYFILISIYTVKNLLDKQVDNVMNKDSVFANFTMQKLKENIIDKLFDKNDNDLRRTFDKELPFQNCDHQLVRLALYDMEKKRKKNK